MSSIDVEALLKPVTAEKPEGEDFEYDNEFMELEVAARGKPDEEIGNVKKAAEEPDWKDVRKRAVELSGKTRDVRVAMYLALGLLKTEGFAGFSAALSVLEGLLDRYWDVCYPKLDPDDNNDPTMRLNALAVLGPSGDARQRIRETPLANSRQVGRFGLREILIATGQEPPPPPVEGQPGPPDGAMIEAAFRDTSPEDLQATVQGLEESIVHVGAIDALVTKKAGSGKGPSLQELTKLLKEVQRHLGEFMRKVGRGEGAPGEVASAPAGGGGGVVRGGGGAPISGDVASADDAVRMMDKIVAYFEAYEPSSPVPLLIKRARRLVKRDFMSLMRDLAPDAISRIDMISGADTASAAGRIRSEVVVKSKSRKHLPP